MGGLARGAGRRAAMGCGPVGTAAGATTATGATAGAAAGATASAASPVSPTTTSSPVPATTAATATSGPTNEAAHGAAPAPGHHAHHRRHRWFWLDVSAGYSWINLVALKNDNFAPTLSQNKGSGFVTEVGAGVQLSILRIGMTGSFARYSTSFDVMTAELDAELVIPVPLVEPSIHVGFGGVWVGQVDFGTNTTYSGQIHGIVADIGLGIDVHITDLLRLGVAVDGSFLNLQRQAVTDFGTLTSFDATQPGNSLGVQVNAQGRLTLEF